ncbi:MAG: hypothetical protein RSB04_06685 [Gordonibacter sp.]|uniref:hypothetical protein n=1 Tax=Gordonibacter sp. TaxID=1968902 RepID=UPI002FC7E1A4
MNKSAFKHQQHRIGEVRGQQITRHSRPFTTRASLHHESDTFDERDTQGALRVPRLGVVRKHTTYGFDLRLSQLANAIEEHVRPPSSGAKSGRIS